MLLCVLLLQNLKYISTIKYLLTVVDINRKSWERSEKRSKTSEDDRVRKL